MTVLPRLFDEDRISDATLIPLLGIAQAFALGIGAFATRDAFSDLHGGASPTYGTLATLLGAGLFAAGLELISRARSEALGQSYARSLRLTLYGHLAGMDRRDVRDRRVGALSLRFVGDLSAARGWFGRGLTRVVSAIVVLPGAAIVLYLLDPILAAMAAVPIGLSLAAMLGLAVGLEARHRSLRSKRGNISIAMMERIAISPDLDLLDRTSHELTMLDEDGDALRKNAVSRVARVGLLRLLPHAGAASAGAAMLWASGRYGINPGATAAGLAVLGILVLPLREFADAWDQFCAWRVARQKALVLLEKPSARRNIACKGEPAEVRLSDVTIGRHHLSLTIQAGALALISGPPGSGKSQLGHVISGLDRAVSGLVLYDGHADTLPRTIHIGDSPVVVQGSMRRALTLGVSPRPGRRQIEQTARSFGLDPLLKRLNGVLGRVGEAARTVSSSEALRLDLARAVLSRPDLIVIDSSRLLADEGRTALLRDLRRLTNCTLVVIGPHLSDVDFDMIVDLSSDPPVPPPKMEACQT